MSKRAADEATPELIELLSEDELREIAGQSAVRAVERELRRRGGDD